MSTDKTLADVQPGGRVRLGDQAELDRLEFQAWARELLPCPFCGNSAEFVPYKDNGLTLKCKSMGCIQRNQRTLRYGIDWLRTSMAEHWNTRALSAQPSPAGQGDANTIEKLRAMMDHSFGGPGFVVYGTAQSIAEVERRLAPTLAARQPVGEPVAEWSKRGGTPTDWRNELLTLAEHHAPIPAFARSAMRVIARSMPAPPAQAVDLGRLRDLARSWIVEAGGTAADTKHACADELLALIDSHSEVSRG
ncbi:TPA: Lar family restriction alleviation protein [Stenotrophomonas maltophilia]|uniref:Lar family restriction alleviation protein n=1 Tax=Stenotrophomonas maltophilia TaxID=40324 RepID=A0AA40Y727_STEMA|nr:Lar family restriction alleviation protein [Stenotrophomonas sp. GD04032]AWB79598.1 hypothetical protein B7H26_17435 [Stenotrophomonas maltophilia]MDU4431560.1 Lar family restriction alleviation protein [Pluralibacter gergoviae]MBH1792029.1 Lar family restriction alleviation protein [Stenotrophomonas maltophilia]MDG9972966.1 Lar family restriction alleviation protein [Stenotrophomonas sp. GD04032]HEL2965707.1 Lar family restriction alleviation protein [Stenotrophomonas maltophilia]